MVLLFWICIAILFYAFLGYGILLYLIILIKRIFSRPKIEQVLLAELPTATLVIAAYNEEGYIKEKILNTLSLTYPTEKINYIIVTDGSTDNTNEIIREFKEINLMYSPERKGKINAIHRVMNEVNSEIVIFTDANTFLNKEALINIGRHYRDKTVGAVAGEKSVQIDKSSDATSGEGFYWKYESKLKKWDSELYSVVGAAGELFSIRTELYEPVASDTILDDFMLSMNIAMKGYRIIYEPEALALETSSANVTEELKRKVRISAGGIQSIIRLKAMWNIFKYPVLSFQYISHRVLRWTVTPFLMILAFIFNIFVVIDNTNIFYSVILILQIIFYGAALFGWLLSRRQIKVKMLFIPYYFCMMNFAVLKGMNRYFSGMQKATWEKAKRK